MVGGFWVSNFKSSAVSQEVNKKMGSKLIWGGLTCLFSLAYLLPALPWQMIGALLLAFGYVLYILDK